MAKPHFRAGVVTVVQRSDGKVLAFERTDRADQWQLPQGGIENGESPKQAAWRELGEETGLDERHVRFVREHDEWTVYTWPKAMRNIWPATFLFVALTWLELGFGVTLNPRATAWFGLAITYVALRLLE